MASVSSLAEVFQPTYGKKVPNESNPKQKSGVSEVVIKDNVTRMSGDMGML